MGFVNVVFHLESSKVVMISHQETGEVLLTIPVEVGDTLSYKWIHSFEHIPWFEYYEIQKDNRLKLFEINVAGFGAGIPENKGSVHIKDGMVIMTDIEEFYDEINWIHSTTAVDHIAINGKIMVNAKDLPHHEPLNLSIKGRLTQWLN